MAYIYCSRLKKSKSGLSNYRHCVFNTVFGTAVVAKVHDLEKDKYYSVVRGYFKDENKAVNSAKKYQKTGFMIR